MDKGFNKGKSDKRISRRRFLWISIAVVITMAIFAAFRFDLVLAIRKFFGFEKEVDSTIQAEIERVQKLHPDRWIASYLFFFFQDHRIRFVIPRWLESKVIRYWSWRMLRSRSVSWPFVGYPQIGDEYFCDGLIRLP
jgi:hypothetical protein